MSGRKRHLLVDTEGTLLDVRVEPADQHDGHGGPRLLARARPKLPSLKKLWVDAGYAGQCAECLRHSFQLDVEVVRRPSDRGHGLWGDTRRPRPRVPAGFQVQPRRWVVERTFGWLGRNRRLSKDYEARCDTEEAWIWLASLRLLIRRLATHAPARPRRARDGPNL